MTARGRACSIYYGESNGSAVRLSEARGRCGAVPARCREQAAKQRGAGKLIEQAPVWDTCVMSGGSQRAGSGLGAPAVIRPLKNQARHGLDLHTSLPRGHKKAEIGRCNCSGPVSTDGSILGGIRSNSATVGRAV